MDRLIQRVRMPEISYLGIVARFACGQTCQGEFMDAGSVKD